MYLGNPLVDLAAAIHHAAFVALPTLEYEERDYEAMYAMKPAERHAIHRGNHPAPMRVAQRRPHARECEVIAFFPQTWGSTALGFGGLGGAAMTPAYTIVIGGPDGSLAVYWGGGFAYLVVTAAGRAARMTDVDRQQTASRQDMDRYKALGGNGSGPAPIVRITDFSGFAERRLSSPIAVLATSLYHGAASARRDSSLDLHDLSVAAMFAEEATDEIAKYGVKRMYCVVIEHRSAPRTCCVYYEGFQVTTFDPLTTQFRRETLLSPR